MNKFGIVLGAAAIATLAGCKDPDYKYDSSKSQNEVKNVDTVVAEPAAKKCTCPPGTKHETPCSCGAPDCKCVVEAKPIVVTPVPVAPVAAPAPVEPECTVYVVQRGDYLAKISKKFNVTINSIQRLNPSTKNGVVRLGQKLKIPGKHDVSAAEQVSSAAPVAIKKASKKSVAPYTGATKEYVVKNGDTLGAVAYGNGITIRQLKELNGLTKDTLFVGQKLKVPAEKVAKAAKPAKADKTADKAAVKPAKSAEEAKKAAPAKETTPAPAAAEPAAAAPAPVAVAPVAAPGAAAPAAAAPAAADAPAAAPAPAEAAPAAKAESQPATTTYVVQEGDDMTGVSIRWGVSAAEIRELNNMAAGDQLVPGQIIKLPAEAQQ